MSRNAFVLPVLVASFAAWLLATPRQASAAVARGRPRTGIVYAAPARILRGQRALERLGDLTRGRYEPGEYDAPTVRAIRNFQFAHGLVPIGRFDWETCAILPIDERPDADDDGVPDAEDRCPSTPKEARKGTPVRVDQDGCPIGPKPA